MPLKPDQETKGANNGAERLPAEGLMVDNTHIYPIRVYYEDTDVGGVVYYANYLKFAERARTEMLRSIGFPHKEMMESHGCAFAVRRCEADYILPAHFDDALEVHSDNIDMEAAGFWLDQRIKRGGEDLAVLRIRLACVGPNGRPVRVPPGLRAAIRALAEPDEEARKRIVRQEASKEIMEESGISAVKERV